MKRKVLFFHSPYQIEVKEQPQQRPGPGQVLVKTEFSAISAGTELLLYRGKLPQNMALDLNISWLKRPLRYPVPYGYSAAGVVIDTGSTKDRNWLGKRVFSFQPHSTSFIAPIEELIALPDNLNSRDAVFLATMETAVNLVMDAKPLIGEQVLILGQGMVGLLTVSLLARFPLGLLLSLDYYPLRRQASLNMGCSVCLNPEDNSTPDILRQSFLSGSRDGLADLTLELSGNPQALNQAISWTGFGGRIVLGSWYGDKESKIRLGEEFHRSRISIASSQVSTVAPELGARWNKERRMQRAIKEVIFMHPSKLITHEFPLEKASEAFELLDRCPGEILQAIFHYSEKNP